MKQTKYLNKSLEKLLLFRKSSNKLPTEELLDCFFNNIIIPKGISTLEYLLNESYSYFYSEENRTTKDIYNIYIKKYLKKLNIPILFTESSNVNINSTNTNLLSLNNEYYTININRNIIENKLTKNLLSYFRKSTTTSNINILLPNILLRNIKSIRLSSDITNPIKMIYFKIHNQIKPQYYNIRTAIPPIKARNSLSKFLDNSIYSYDSDDEWEEIEGESIDSIEDDDEEIEGENDWVEETEEILIRKGNLPSLDHPICLEVIKEIEV